MNRRCRRGRTGALIVVLLLVIAGTGAFAIDPANLNRVTFVNNTGYDIVYLFLSPGDSEYWGADVLGTTRTLDNGGRVGFYIHYPDASNEFDFLAIDEDGDAYIVWNYEITDGSPAMIDVTRADLEGGYDLPELATVTFANDTGYDIWYAFFSPGDSNMWGIDMLGDETILQTRESLSLFVPVTNSPTSYDFQGVDVDEDEYEIWGIEVSDRSLEYDIPVELSDIVR